MSRMKVLIILYGIGRGADVSRKSIDTKIVKTIYRDHELDILEIRDNVNSINNARSGEFGALNVKNFYYEESTKHLVDTNISELNLLHKESMKFIDVHRDDYQSNKNLLKQLILLDVARQSLSEYNIKHDIVFALRDDLLWCSEVDFTPIFDCVMNNDEYFTSSHYWNGGVSERFFISNKTVAETVLGRVHCVKDFLNSTVNLSYVKVNGLNAEWLMRYILEANEIKILASPIITPRVRINGEVKRDYLWPRPWRINCFVNSQKAKLRYRLIAGGKIINK